MGALDLAIGLFRNVTGRLFDRPLGTTYPGRQQRLPERDARDHALDALREVLALVEFANPGREGTFKIPAERIFTEWPAGFLRDPKLPAIGLSSFAQATVENAWLGAPRLLDDTFDRYGCGTALAWIGTHEERITAEAWCRSDPERQSVLAGLKATFRASEVRGSLLLSLPCYFDRKARFALDGVTVPDDADTVGTGRRRILLSLDLWVPDVILVDAGTMRPIGRLAVSSDAAI